MISTEICRPDKPGDVVRTDRGDDEGERAEQRDGIVVPPQPLRIPCKTSVEGNEKRDDEQDN